MRRSREEDLSSVEDTNCLYRAAGYDKQGRAVIVFIGKWFRQSQLDLDKALLYLLKVVDPVADAGEYVVIYFHTRTSRENIPSYWWIKHVYNTLPYKYKKNLKASMLYSYGSASMPSTYNSNVTFAAAFGKRACVVGSISFLPSLFCEIVSCAPAKERERDQANSLSELRRIVREEGCQLILRKHAKSSAVRLLLVRAKAGSRERGPVGGVLHHDFMLTWQPGRPQTVLFCQRLSSD